MITEEEQELIRKGLLERSGLNDDQPYVRVAKNIDKKKDSLHTYKRWLKRLWEYNNDN